MKIQDLLNNILKDSRHIGTCPLTELLPLTESRGINGIAVAKDREQELYITFLHGEPEGAIYIDDKGILFGDKAALMISGREKFDLAEIGGDIVEALIMSCRIYDKKRLKKSIMHVVPEIGKTGSSIGALSVTVMKDGTPANGIRVSIRKDGQVVGSDITTGDGNVGFRVAYGDYDCILQDRAQVVTKHKISFDAAHPSIQISI